MADGGVFAHLLASESGHRAGVHLSLHWREILTGFFLEAITLPHHTDLMCRVRQGLSRYRGVNIQLNNFLKMIHSASPNFLWFSILIC